MQKISLYFWQNCISPHQLPYIKELHKDKRISKVYLIAPVGVSDSRKKMGWENLDNVEEVEIIISTDKNVIDNLFITNQENSIHFFSGIHADKYVFEYFKISLNYNIKRGLITEPPFDYKIPLFFHKIRFFLFDYKYISKIDYVFGMGDKAVKYYNLWSKKWKVFLFGYCVNYKLHFNSNHQAENLRFLYVGSLIKRKNVSLLIKGIGKLKEESGFSLDIIGDGIEHDKLINYVQENNLNDKVHFIGKLSMGDIYNKLSEYNVLILPSVHDGWGAVINEGLQSGLFIISSDNCGAKTLIENSNRGIVFKNKNLDSLTNALNYCIGNADKIKSGKQERIDWSACISGVSMANYMIDCLLEQEPVLPPWEK